MPHVILKLYQGRSEQQKADLADAVAKAVVEKAGCKDSAVSVAIEEYDPQQWAEAVYKPDILDRQEILYKKPGYNPF